MRSGRKAARFPRMRSTSPKLQADPATLPLFGCLDGKPSLLRTLLVAGEPPRAALRIRPLRSRMATSPSARPRCAGAPTSRRGCPRSCITCSSTSRARSASSASPGLITPSRSETCTPPASARSPPSISRTSARPSLPSRVSTSSGTGSGCRVRRRRRNGTRAFRADR